MNALHCGLPLATCRVLSQRSCHQDDHQLKRGVAALSISLSLFFVLQTSYDSDMSKGNRKCILVVGSCGLDRLLTVQRFPVPDSKVRTTSYNEVGGGNAANTAAAMAMISDSKFAAPESIRIKFLTKVGNDSIGQQLSDELSDAGVDTSSPLFRTGHPGSNTAFTTVIVSEEECTRTCIHTPGSCGELTLDDVRCVDLNQVFEDVVHLHSDSRHTEAALYLALEAKSRGVRVSLDCEKDRSTTNLDQLLEVCDILFTNAQHLSSYMSRREHEMQLMHNRIPLPKPQTISTLAGMPDDTLNLYSTSMTPIAFFARWFPESEKRVVVTHGSAGALHFQPISITREAGVGDKKLNEIHLSEDEEDILIHHRYSDMYGGESKVVHVKYKLNQTGVLPDLRVVDSTGAGDAFCGGFLVASVACCDSHESTQFCMDFGSWVAGRKLEGHGARNALPRGKDVDISLGCDLPVIRDALREKLTSFNARNGQCYQLSNYFEDHTN